MPLAVLTRTRSSKYVYKYTPLEGALFVDTLTTLGRYMRDSGGISLFAKEWDLRNFILFCSSSRIRGGEEYPSFHKVSSKIHGSLRNF